MPDYLLPTLAKVLLPAIVIVFMVLVVAKKKLSLSEDIGFRAPNFAGAAAFFVFWLVLIAAEELLGQSTPKPWRDFPVGIIALRILAIGILGPIAEEIAFRGLLLFALKRTRLGVYGAIAVTSIVWSLVHTQYELPLLALLLFDGIVLGLARHFTRSIYVPIAMHITGNLFSVWQSLQSAA